jgi:hypothetical protein
VLGPLADSSSISTTKPVKKQMGLLATSQRHGGLGCCCCCIFLAAAIWFHTATTLLSVFPLLAGVPNKPVLLSGGDGNLMLGVAATSFVAQLLSTRGLQRCQAAKAAAMGFTQVITKQRSSTARNTHVILRLFKQPKLMSSDFRNLSHISAGYTSCAVCPHTATPVYARCWLQVVYSHIMGAVFFGDKLTLAGLWGALLILSGVLLVTLRSAGSKGSTKKDAAACSDQAAATVTGRAPASFSKGLESPSAALLPSGHVSSHLAAVAAEAKLPDDEDSSEEAVALVSLVADSRQAPSKQLAGSPKAESEQLLDSNTRSAPIHDTAAATAAGDGNDDVSADAEPAIEPCLLAQIAASAAAALGGELCPAGSTAAALELSRQVSVQVGASRVMSQMSRQTSQMLFGQSSQFLFGSPSAFIMAPGLTPPLERPAQQQQQRQPPQQQQQEEAGHAGITQQQQQQWGSSPEAQAGSPVLKHTLKQALLCDESLPSSPGSSSPTYHRQHADNGQ